MVRRSPIGRGSDRGSGTIIMVALMGVIWLVAVTLMTAGGVRAARHRAHAAADLAALAAAGRASQGDAEACRWAATVAHDMGTRLVSCTLTGGPTAAGKGDGRIADVSVTRIFHGPALVGQVRIPARARAGPAAPDEPSR